VRPCVIFNPAAKGEKARRFRAELDRIAAVSVFKLTAAAGDARRLAAEAVREGHDTVVAVGGDGTLNEVLNGIAHDADRSAFYLTGKYWPYVYEVRFVPASG